MEHRSFDHHIFELTSEVGVLRLLLMFLNLLFTGGGLLVDYFTPLQSTNCSNITFHQTWVQRPQGAVLYGLSIALFLIMGICCLRIVPYCCGTNHKCIKSLLQRCWRQRRGILVLIIGAVYLAGDNLVLVDKCLHIPDLLGVSLTAGIMFDVYKSYEGGLGENQGGAQQRLIGARALAVGRLFPLLMRTVHFDHVYTTIVREMSLYPKSEAHGLAFFIFVCVSWCIVVLCVIIKSWRNILKFNEENIKCQKFILILFLFLLLLYAPAYIALDNREPWEHIAKYYYQEESTIAVQKYLVPRLSLLFILSLVTAILGVIYYICCCTISRCLSQRQDGERERLLNHSADHTVQA